MSEFVFFFSKVFDNDLQVQISQTDTCLTPSADSDSPLLIEEYHQLFRIVMLHELEDTRDMVGRQFQLIIRIR